uniref:VPS37D subunit of ESCRT-I n=1 Tax=Pavo cristatus TaxID=9049 RepID=A0A8C9ERS3_PAVCR
CAVIGQGATGTNPDSPHQHREELLCCEGLRALLQDEPRLQRAVRLSRKTQMQRFLAHEVPLDAFLESFCRSRARSHVSRTQLEKLQELLQRDRDPAGEPPGLNPAPGRSAASPKALQLRCGFVPAVLVPAAAVVPFAVPSKHRLPALGQPPAAPHPAPHAAPLSPRPFRRREPEPLQP